MFTGIVAELGTVTALSASSIAVQTGIVAQLGDSIAVNGCCLTVTAATDDGYRFDVMPVTFAHTNLGDLTVGDPINLEPAVAAGAPMGGHWVQGHVDSAGIVRSTRRDGNSLIVTVDAPDEVLRYCVERGSIGVNGVSLTVMALLEDGFELHLIPETQERTTLGRAHQGVRLNLEADILARYVERLFGAQASRTVH